jgi:hypothetical protein
VICECGSRLPDQTVSELVAAWFAGEQTMSDAVHDAPEVAWAAILQILEMELTEDQISVLAAGALEGLMALHGAQFVERVEHKAEQNARFTYLLGGVWKNGISPAVWERVQKARTQVW